MATIMPLSDALEHYVHDGDSIAIEGFTHLIPFAAVHEIIRQKRRELAVIRMTPDLISDLLIGAGCVRHLTFSWGGNPGVGSLHRLRDAVENGWPRAIQFEEHSHAGMANAFHAGASGLPFAVLRGYVGTDLREMNTNIRWITCPFTGEKLTAVPALRPDVTVIHAQRADHHGNVLVEGVVGVQKEAVLAASRSVVTVEEVVEDLAAPSPNSVIIPSWVIDAVAVVPRGAAPSYAHGYYARDNAFYMAWDSISRDRDQFLAWIDEHVFGSHMPRGSGE